MERGQPEERENRVQVYNLFLISDKPDKMGSLKPEITRGLTELFLIVEDLAQKWDMEQDLMLETVSEDSILKWFEKVRLVSGCILTHFALKP